MARSAWKGPFCELYVIKKAEKVKASGKIAPIRIWARSSTILPQFVGLVFEVHNGKTFITVSIDELKVGQKFGSFAMTRRFTGHAGGDKKASRK